MSSEKDIDFVLRTVEKRDIRFVRLWFSDVLGNLKSFAISPEELEEAFEEGIGFDGSAVDGFASLEESDMLAFPDPSTFALLPWRPSESGVARVFCDVYTPAREPFEGDPRRCLKNVFTRAEEQGFVPNVGPKMEYFYFDNDLDPVPLDNAGYFDLTPMDTANDLRRQTTLTLEKMSIPVQYSYHAAGPSQNGVELRFTEAVSCADNIMTARLVIKQEASTQGMYASFMPKPITTAPGSAMFLYQSLLDHDGENLFWAPKEEHEAHLSELAQHYIAGILKYAPEFTLVTNPTVNSYKRFISTGEVPTHATWGRKNRSALVRIPAHKPGKHIATRIELRSPDPTANPYSPSPRRSPPASRASKRACPCRRRPRAASACRTPSARPSTASSPPSSCVRSSATTSSTTSCVRSARSGTSTAPPSPTGSASTTTAASSRSGQTRRTRRPGPHGLGRLALLGKPASWPHRSSRQIRVNPVKKRPVPEKRPRQGRN